MAVDHYHAVSFQISYKTLQRVEKLAQEFGMSRANTLQKLVEEALHQHGEPLEDSTTFNKGEKNRYSRPKRVINELRRLL